MEKMINKPHILQVWDEAHKDKPKPPNFWQQISEWTKQKLKPRLFWSGGAYRRPKLKGEIEGELNIKFAKKQRIKAIKLAQGRG